MKNNIKIISLIIAIVAGVIDFAILNFNKTQCYYGDFADSEKLLAIKNACYQKYSTSRYIIEITCVLLITYIFAFFVMKYMKKNK